jgi:hypothetical protein
MAFDGFCEIRRAGILPDGRAQIDIRAVDGSFDWRWVFSNAARGREVLAVALTAIATNRGVGCYMSQPNGNPPVLDGWFGLHK